jgi:NADH-quinone oxidoreductase subunit G
MATVTVNDQLVDIGNEKLNLVQVAEKAGILVPHYCWHPALTVVASCRMCLVEVKAVGKKPDGSPIPAPKAILPACQTVATDGTVFYTNSELAKRAQADTLEGLLLNHPLDCPVCDKAGECKLQDYSYQFGRSESRMIEPKNTPPNKPHLSEKITLFTDRCIMCSRCVRFTREIAGTAELQIISRGHHSEIDIFPGQPLANKLSGNVIDLCPVGALGSKDFLYKQRVWYLEETESVCAGCSTGCSVYLDANKDILYRIRARYNPEAQGYFICDDGRWGFHYVTSRSRITQARIDGRSARSWTETIDVIQQLIEDQTRPFAVYFSPFLTVEEAYLWAQYFSQFKQASFFMGPIPIVGVDDTYPKTRKGEPASPVVFTIRAEKAPNRVGVTKVLQHFQEQFKTAESETSFEALVWLGGYPDPKLIENQINQLSSTRNVLIAVDLFDSALTSKAKIVIPATSWSEKDGVYLNYASLAQRVRRATRPPTGIRSELQLAYDLLGRRGLVQSKTIRSEVADAITDLQSLVELEGSKYGLKISLPVTSNGQPVTTH